MSMIPLYLHYNIHAAHWGKITDTNVSNPGMDSTKLLGYIWSDDTGEDAFFPVCQWIEAHDDHDMQTGIAASKDVNSGPNIQLFRDASWSLNRHFGWAPNYSLHGATLELRTFLTSQGGSPFPVCADNGSVAFSENVDGDNNHCSFYIRPPGDITIQEINFDPFQDDFFKDGTQQLSEWSTDNPTDIPAEHTATVSVSKEVSVALTWSNATTVGVELTSEVDAEVVKESIGFSVSDTFTFGKTQTTTNLSSVGDSYQQPVPPHTHMEGATVVTYGTLTLPFTATLQLNGETWTERGSLTAENSYKVKYEVTKQTPIQG